MGPCFEAAASGASTFAQFCVNAGDEIIEFASKNPALTICTLAAVTALATITCACHYRKQNAVLHRQVSQQNARIGFDAMQIQAQQAEITSLRTRITRGIAGLIG